MLFNEQSKSISLKTKELSLSVWTLKNSYAYNLWFQFIGLNCTLILPSKQLLSQHHTNQYLIMKLRTQFYNPKSTDFSLRQKHYNTFRWLLCFFQILMRFLKSAYYHFLRNCRHFPRFNLAKQRKNEVLFKRKLNLIYFGKLHASASDYSIPNAIFILIFETHHLLVLSNYVNIETSSWSTDEKKKTLRKQRYRRNRKKRQM